MYLTTPQRYPYMKGIPSSPVMPRNFYPATSPTMSFVQPLTAPNTGRPHQQFPISQRGPVPFPYHRASTPQARPTGKTVPSNPPQYIPGSFPLNFQPQVRPQNQPQSKTIPVQLQRPSSAQPVQQNPKLTNEKQMIQNLSKENQDLKKKLTEKEQELQKLKSREEALEQKFKELQEQSKK